MFRVKRNETTQNKDNNIDQLFSNNCMTIESYLNDFVNESIDYENITMTHVR